MSLSKECVAASLSFRHLHVNRPLNNINFFLAGVFGKADNVIHRIRMTLIEWLLLSILIIPIHWRGISCIFSKISHNLTAEITNRMRHLTRLIMTMLSWKCEPVRKISCSEATKSNVHVYFPGRESETIQHNEIMVPFDVESLFTNVSIDAPVESALQNL